MTCHLRHADCVIPHDRKCKGCGATLPASGQSREHNRNRCPDCHDLRFGEDRVYGKIPEGFQAVDLRREKSEAQPYVPLNRCEHCGCHIPKKGKCSCKGPIETPERVAPDRYDNFPQVPPSNGPPVWTIARGREECGAWDSLLKHADDPSIRIRELRATFPGAMIEEALSAGWIAVERQWQYPDRDGIDYTSYRITRLGRDHAVQLEVAR